MAASASIDAIDWLRKQVEGAPDGLRTMLTEMVNVLMSAEIDAVCGAGYGERSDDALGVSTRKVEDLVQALGIEKLSKSQVSQLSKELDDVVKSFRERPLAGPYKYLWLDALYLKCRE